MIEIKTDYTVSNVEFPSLNKQNSWKEYMSLEVVNEGYFHRDVKVVKEIICETAVEWNDLVNSFMVDNEVYERIGGWEVPDGICEKLGYKDDQAFSTWYYNLEEPKFKELEKHMIFPVVAIYNYDRSRRCFVNTEKYDYARYVGFDKDLIERNKDRVWKRVK